MNLIHNPLIKEIIAQRLPLSVPSNYENQLKGLNVKEIYFFETLNDNLIKVGINCNCLVVFRDGTFVRFDISNKDDWHSILSNLI